VFCDAERVLSALAKFLVHLLGEGEWRGEIGERRGRREWGENGEGMEVREMGMHGKITPKRNSCGIWGRLLGVPPRHTVSYIFGKRFSGTTLQGSMPLS